MPRPRRTRAGRRQQDRLREQQAGHRRRASGTSTAPATTSIQGFATDISVNVGQPDRLQDRHRRLGLHDRHLPPRLLRRRRRPQDRRPSRRRPRCRRTSRSASPTSTTELYDCGNWAVSASWNVPATAVSGVYIAQLHRAATRRRRATSPSSSATTPATPTSSSRPRTRPGRPTTPTAAPTSTSGGGQRPRLQGQLQPARSPPAAAPAAATSSSPTSTRWCASWSATATTSATSPASTPTAAATCCTNHKMFLSVGHDEYWSGHAARQRRGRPRRRRQPAVPQRQRGVLADPLRGLRRTAATRRTARWSATRRPGPTPRSTRRRSGPAPGATRGSPAGQGGGRPENALTGTMYMVQLRRPAGHGQRRARASTGCGATPRWPRWPPGSTATLAPHTVGYESNEDLDNGFRPAGLIRLSTTTGPTPRVPARTSATPSRRARPPTT